jgi:two-component system nitrate/nitrite response regulator NarL
MSTPSANVAVISSCLYRAESVALSLNRHSSFIADSFAQPNLDALGTYEIIAIDVDSPIDPALELVHSITTRYPTAKVVILGVEESEEKIVKLAVAGASGYVPPSSSSEELIRVLQSVENEEFTCPPHITHALFSHLANLASSQGRSVLPSPVLTIRERKILGLLSHNLTNREIAARLCISESTAKNHVHRILKKLGVRNRNLASRG